MTYSEKWPKKLPSLTEEQKRIREEYMITWHKILPNKYSIIEKFNHVGAFRKSELPDNCRTLEIGVGLGEHIKFEDLSRQDYYGLELRADMAEQAQRRFPPVKIIIGDIQQQQDLPNEYFDRIIAVHVLEHLPNLPQALREVKRLIKPNGFWDLVIPCQGGLAYSLASRISARRIFEKTYKTSYDFFIKSEHVNTCYEIIEELKNAGFAISWKRYFPFPIPFFFCNLSVGIRCNIKK